MPPALQAPDVLNAEFLSIRAKILEVAAALDRLDRADGSVRTDPRLGQIRAGLETLLAPGPGRAEKIQLAFSLPYDDDWKQQFELPRTSQR